MSTRRRDQIAEKGRCMSKNSGVRVIEDDKKCEGIDVRQEDRRGQREEGHKKRRSREM